MATEFQVYPRKSAQDAFAANKTNVDSKEWPDVELSDSHDFYYCYTKKNTPLPDTYVIVQNAFDMKVVPAAAEKFKINKNAYDVLIRQKHLQDITPVKVKVDKRMGMDAGRPDNKKQTGQQMVGFEMKAVNAKKTTAIPSAWNYAWGVLPPAIAASMYFVDPTAGAFAMVSCVLSPLLGSTVRGIKEGVQDLCASYSSQKNKGTQQQALLPTAAVASDAKENISTSQQYRNFMGTLFCSRAAKRLYVESGVAGLSYVTSRYLAQPPASDPNYQPTYGIHNQLHYPETVAFSTAGCVAAVTNTVDTYLRRSYPS